ncbi:hypothetical protein [Phytobacter diazotrophicus]|uniref:hypothetical protein n=1 Tax=Phytobacter diazotrophicus TaxID=395631 RepID=UPI0030767F0F
MNNRKASLLLKVSVKNGGVCTIRISNRRRVVIYPNGSIVGAQQTKPSARQNRWNNHCQFVEDRS